MDDIRIAYTAPERRAAVIAIAALALLLAGFTWLLDLRAHGSGVWTAPIGMTILGLPALGYLLNFCFGSTNVTAHEVRIRSLTGRKTIAWTDIQGIEVKTRHTRRGSFQVLRLHRVSDRPATVLGMLSVPTNAARANAFMTNVNHLHQRWQTATGSDAPVRFTG